jgi:hypothetical protein
MLGRVPHQRLKKLLRGRPVTLDDLKHLKAALGDDTYVRKARHSVGSHYDFDDIQTVYERDLNDDAIDGSLVARDIAWLSRYTITDVLALRLLDEAAGAASHDQFSARSGEVTQLALELVPAVNHLVAGLLKERGFQATPDTVKVPDVLRAALDWAEREQARTAGAPDASV